MPGSVLNAEPRRRVRLVIIKPPGYTHSGVFQEMAELYAVTLQELGYEVSFVYNQLAEDGLNLIFGYHMLSAGAIPPPHFRYVVIQVEQLNPAGGLCARPGVFESLIPLLRQAEEIWDFCPSNLAYLERWGLKARLMPPGYHPRLRRIQPAARQDIDVLFVGSYSPHRAKIIDSLAKHCRVQALKDCYGPERDAWISRSKIVLNLHAYANLTALEQFRIFYLFSQPCFVLSEASVDNPYGDSLLCYQHSELVTATLSWLATSQTERGVVAERGFQSLCGLDFRGQLLAAMSALGV